MANDNIERLHFYQRQYLGMLDFEDEQAYHRDMRRRHNLAHHTWGIVTGLEVVFHQDDGSVWINPGMAIDGYGREIIVLLPYQLDPALFLPLGSGDWTVCLEYSEALTQSPQSGYGQCDPASNQYRRVEETFNLVVQEPFRQDITIAGKAVLPKLSLLKSLSPEDKPILPDEQLPSQGPGDLIIPLDESVPYQEFSIDDPSIPVRTQWLVPLGKVEWNGTQFVQNKAKPFLSEEGRHYIGSISSRILTPARNLIVRDRNTDVPLPPFDPNKKPPPVPDGVAMIIEGTLQVDRLLAAKDDIQIHGRALDFRNIGDDDSQTDDKRLYTISRIDGGSAGGIDLRIKIGVDSKGFNRFVIGTDDTNDLFAVDDAGNTYLFGVLDFGSKPRQMITLWSSPDKSQQNTIGIQAIGSPVGSQPTIATTYFRSSNDFYWYKGGSHSDVPGEPGKAGSMLMKLDAIGLHINGDLEISNGLNIHGGLEVSGGLIVHGPTDLTKSLTVEEDTNLKQNLTVDGSTTLKSSLSVTGATDLKSSLSVTGATDLFGNLSVINGVTDLAGNLSVTGATDLAGNLSVTGATDLAGNLAVTGATDLAGNLAVIGTTDLNNTTVGGSITLNGALILPGAVSLQGNNGGLEVSGSHVSFISTANPTYEVMLGYISAPGAPTHHDSDSVYGTPNLWLDTAGTVFIKQGFQTRAMDGAEFFSKSEPVEPGDVVVLSDNGEGSIKLTQSENDVSVIGVVSTNPAFILGGPASAGEIEAVRQNTVPVALIGRVPCKVDADRGPIHKGDLLTTSPTKGHAQKVKDPSKATGAVLGKALEDLEKGQGLITILILLA